MEQLMKELLERIEALERRMLAMRLLQYLYQRFYIVSIQCFKIVPF